VPESDPLPVDNPHADTPGHPEARGTLPMAHNLIDPATEAEIQALAAEAPLPSADQAARLARLLRLHHAAAPTRPSDDAGAA
jgi:hypothetical protein